MLDTVKINHVQHISFTQSRLTDAVSVILSELLSYEHPSKSGEPFRTYNIVLKMTHILRSVTLLSHRSIFNFFKSGLRHLFKFQNTFFPGQI